MKQIPFAKFSLAVLFLGLSISDGHAQANNSADVDAFQVADQAGTRDAYQGYLDAFPTGVFSVVARERARPALLTDLLPRMTPDKPKRGKSARSELDQVWQEAWDRVKASDTEAGYLEYLSIRGPAYIVRPALRDAMSRYYELAEGNAASVPTGLACNVPNRDVKRLTNFSIERAYPEKAIAAGLQGTIDGFHIVASTGKVLGFLITHVTEPAFYVPVTNEAMNMSFSPARRNCLNVASLPKLTVSFTTSFSSSR